MDFVFCISYFVFRRDTGYERRDTKKMAMKLYIGTSGYDYPHWGEGVFYHSGLPTDKWLEFYSRQFNGLELATTAHQPPDNDTIMTWLKTTPREFRFAVKGPAYITHIKRLKDAGESLEAMAGSMKILKPKIACFLWQLPSGFKKDNQGLADFCSLLRRAKPFAEFRHVFEFADASWSCGDVYRILKITTVVCALRIRRRSPGSGRSPRILFICVVTAARRSIIPIIHVTNWNNWPIRCALSATRSKRFTRFSATTNRGSRRATRRRSVCCFWSGGCSDDFLARGVSCC